MPEAKHGTNVRFQDLVLRARCAVPFLRNLPMKIRNGPLAGYRWLPSPRDTAYLDGRYEPETQTIFLKMVARGSVVYDLGAHRGFFTLLAARIVGPQGRVVAFEPSSRNERRVRAQAALNGLKQVSSYPYAISSVSGMVDFSDLKDDLANTLLKTSPSFSATRTLQRVESRRLDDLVERELPPPQFIKMDIEGAELEALEGGRLMLARHRPVLYFSVHPNHLPGVEAKCLELLTLLEYNVALVQINPFDSGIRDYLAVPKTRTVPSGTKAGLGRV